MTTQFVLQSAVKFPVGLWIDAPPFAYQSMRPVAPFDLYVYTEDNEPHIVQLYSQGSKSMPWQVPQNKWSVLNPQWRFTDLSGNAIDQLTVTDAVTTTFNGTTGYLASAQFYYIDDMPSDVCSSLLLWATIDFSMYPVQKDVVPNTANVPGYSNSKVVAAVPYMINPLTPRRLNVNRDTVNDMFDSYWTNAIIPHVVSVIGDDGDCGTDASGSAIMLNVPATNALGVSAGPVYRAISGIPVNGLTWSPVSSGAFLSAEDFQFFNVGGYLKGSVASASARNTVSITSSATLYYENLPVHYPYFWISNPENNTINRVYLPIVHSEWLTDEIPFISNYKEEVYDTSYLQVTAPVVMGLSGFHGIYGIALDKVKNMWCTDAESDRVYKFSSEGVLLSTINFGEGSPYGESISGGCTPVGIALDNSCGAWVTFFDSISVVCINTRNGEIKTTINAGDPTIIPPAPYISGGYADPLYKPVLAEPDMNDDVWVSYQNSLCSCLMKYTNDGDYISSIALPLCSNPMDMHIDINNNIWVTLSTNSGPPYIGHVNKYDTTTGTLLSSISARNPAYLAIDPYETIWFTQSGNTLTRITTAGLLTHWHVGSAILSAFSSPPNDIFLDDALGGLCVDVCNRLHIINSIDNILYTLSGDVIVPVVNITPDYNLSWYNDASGGAIYALSGDFYKSAQAFGDWSGYKWIKKYQNAKVEPYAVVSLSGESTSFDILDFVGYDLRRFNESWDATNEIKKVAKSPHIADNTNLWGKYMNAVWGSKDSPQGTGYGREAYEKIANFAANHIDVNTCNVNQLYSLAQYTDVPIDEYGFEMPSELRRMIDIASVNQQILWGARCGCKQNITNTYTTYTSGGVLVDTKTKCERCGHLHPGNRGELFNPETYMVSAYVPFIVEDRTNHKNRYQLITPSPSCSINMSNSLIGDICEVSATSVTCITSYPLSAAYNILLPEVYTFDSPPTWNDFQEAIAYFCFYDYVSIKCEEQIAGVINWEDPHTTLSENASSVEEWYGEGQILERMINYILHKGLGLVP